MLHRSSSKTRFSGKEAKVVAGFVVFGLLTVAMIGIMLYGIFTEGRRR